MPQHPTLVLTAGGLRSLVAAAAVLSATDRAEVVLLHLREEPGASGGAGATLAGNRAAYARRQAEHFRLRQFFVLDLPRPHSPEGTPIQQAAARAPLVRPQVLLAAVAQAVQLHARRVVWPVQANADFNAVARVTEQVVLLQHLAGLDQPELPAIETPLLELSDRQIVELGAHLGVPWHLAWTCALQGEKPCRVCAGCRRRRAAFDAARISDAADVAPATPKLARARV